MKEEADLYMLMHISGILVFQKSHTYSTILTSKPKYKVPHCQWVRFKYPIARTVLNDIIDIKGACPTYSMWFDFEFFSNILQMIKHNSLFILQFFFNSQYINIYLIVTTEKISSIKPFLRCILHEKSTESLQTPTYRG